MKWRDAIAHLIGMHEDVLAGFHRKCSFIPLLPKLRLARKCPGNPASLIRRPQLSQRKTGTPFEPFMFRRISPTHR
jgi:hypothetical protein